MTNEVSSPAVSSSVILNIPTGQIHFSPHQIRKDPDPEGIRLLAKSIEHEGLLQPITVRQTNVKREASLDTSTMTGDPALDDSRVTTYELIAGERRLRAVILLGKPTIEARIIDVPSEAAAAAKGLIENMQRVDLNPIEEAEGFAALNKMDPVYWTQEQIGQVAGKDRTYVNKSIALLDLPEAVLEGVRRRTLLREHGVELLRLSNGNSQKYMAKKIEEGALSVKKIRAMIDVKLAGKGDPKTNGETENKSSEPMGVTFKFKKKGSALVISGLAPEAIGPAELGNFLRCQYQTWSGIPSEIGNMNADQLQTPATEPAMPGATSGDPAPAADSTLVVKPSRPNVPIPQITDANYVSGNRLELKWLPLGDGFQYRIFRSWADPADDSTFKPMEEPPVSTAGAIINFDAAGQTELHVAVMAIDPAGRESRLSKPVLFELKGWNQSSAVDPLP